MNLDIFSAFDAVKTNSSRTSSKAVVDRKRNHADMEGCIQSSAEENFETRERGIEGVGSGSVSTLNTAEEHAEVPPKTHQTPARTYKFKLDTFQQQAVDHIEAGDSVLVAAHTSAGKTAVAEYAIAKSLRDGQRVIYTSPIKALSNQKYRDMQEDFKDVGLMTGDITINPNATCLIMTTEILRSMLYRGSEVMREVAWVIYDEVHYMRDKERGVVWEESIILLPHKVRFVFLSATIPNAEEFVNWVSKIHHQRCHVVYTDYRPVPLQHFIFPAGAPGLFLVVDEKGKFREDNFQKAMSALQAVPEAAAGEKGRKNNSKPTSNKNSDLFKIVRLIMDRELDPCIVFSFSKKSCEAYALQMARLDFNTQDEKDLVEQVFSNAMEALSDDDKSLPQVLTILPLLKRGVGIHHGGLLPILKEVIEILFQEGLIKCLFATETFSIGINMPAKTVVFTDTRKFDGQDFRWITSGEYIQMSGRAGRRGKDDRGIVIQILDEKMEPDVAKNMIYGASDPLFSSYHVSYNMVLNMLRVEDADPENLLRSSFFQFQREKEAPELERQADDLQREAIEITVSNEADVSEFYTSKQLLGKANIEVASVVRRPENSLPFLQTGRILHIVTDSDDWGWGVLVNIRRLAIPEYNSIESKVLNLSSSAGSLSSSPTNDQVVFVLDILFEASRDSDMKLIPRSTDDHSKKLVVDIAIVQATLNTIRGISAVRLNLPKDLEKDSSKRGVLRALSEVQRRFAEKGIPCLDPIADMGITDESFAVIAQRQKDLQARIDASVISKDETALKDVALYSKRVELLEKSRILRQQARESQVVSMKDELRKMKRVLRRLAYISTDGVLSTKGRFSCELSTGDEIVLTDMVFDGVFNDLSVEQSVALLSCFVHKEGKSDEGAVVRAEMQAPLRQLQTVARNVAKVFVDAKLTVDEEEYVQSFNPGLVDVAYAWATGSKFVDICKLTEVFEGSIIRAIRRLDELLRQLASAAVAIGNLELKKTFEDGSNRIRRGVVFAASLYL